jgi:hypothetical protein
MSKPDFVIAIPYRDWSRYQLMRTSFWILLAVGISAGMFNICLGILVFSVPEPILDSLVGFSPERRANLNRNEKARASGKILQAKEEARQRATLEEHRREFRDRVSFP